MTASGRTEPDGWLPALYAVKFGQPLWFMRASAMIERAEFPVHRNKTLKCPGNGILLVAAGWPAAWLLRLYRPNERAHELAIDLWRNCIDIYILVS